MSITLIRIVPEAQTLSVGDNAVPFGRQVSRYLVRNQSTAQIYVALDTAASTGSTPVPPGTHLEVDGLVSVLHLYASAEALVCEPAPDAVEVVGWVSLASVAAGSGLRPRGVFDPTVTDYAPGDAVSDGGLSFVCTAIPSGSVQTRVDTFTRANQSGWGTASDGSSWAIHPILGGTQTNYGTLSVASNEGVLTGTDHDPLVATLGDPFPSPDVEVLARVSMGDLEWDSAGLILRAPVGTAGDAHYSLGFGGSGSPSTTTMNVAVTRYDANFTATELAVTSVACSGPDVFFWVRAQMQGSSYRVRVWGDGTTEGVDWTLEGTDATPPPALGYAGVMLSGTLVGTVKIDHFSARTLGPIVSPPSSDASHWALLAASAPGTPTLHGPYVVDYTDIPHEGDAMTLWTPAVGDVLLRLFGRWQTYVPWDQGELFVGPNVDGTVAPPRNQVGSLPAHGDLYNLDPASKTDITDAIGTYYGVTAHVFATTDPVLIQLAQTAGSDPTQGHVELYALIARAVAP